MIGTDAWRPAGGRRARCYGAVMKRTTISLPDDLAQALEREARRHSVSIAEVARGALSSHFGLSTDEPRHIPFAALGRSAHSDTAERIEELVSEEWHPDRDR
jgi:metal-responsive CopG/Arc/MetJ family transcriptional regulator